MNVFLCLHNAYPGLSKSLYLHDFCPFNSFVTMSTQTINPRTTVLVTIIVVAAAFRLLQSSPVFSVLSNFTPVGAIALFGGCYFADRWKAFLVPLGALFISDVLLNRIYYFDHWTFFYPGAYWIYGSFALVVMLGHFIKKVSVLNVLLSGIGAALIHWIVSDFGVWAGGNTDITTGQPFTPDFGGLLKCYTLALPYLRNMIIGNLVFSGILFGSFEWIKGRYPALHVQPEQA